jgi:hypothetical protein
MEPIPMPQADLDRGRAPRMTGTRRRNRGEVRCAVPRTAGTGPLIDIGSALDLPATAVTQADIDGAS